MGSVYKINCNSHGTGRTTGRPIGVGGLCSQICLLCYSLMLTNSTHYTFISAHYTHIMLEYPNRITGQENNYSNYCIATSRKVQCSPVGYGSGSWILGLEWILGTRTVSTRLCVRLSAVALWDCQRAQIMSEMFLLCLKVYALCSHYARYFQGPIMPDIMPA